MVAKEVQHIPHAGFKSLLHVDLRLMTDLMESGFQLIAKEHVVLQSFDVTVRPCLEPMSTDSRIDQHASRTFLPCFWHARLLGAPLTHGLGMLACLSPVGRRMPNRVNTNGARSSTLCSSTCIWRCIRTHTISGCRVSDTSSLKHYLSSAEVIVQSPENHPVGGAHTHAAEPERTTRICCQPSVLILALTLG